MKATYIDYRDTNSFSKTLLAYLDNDPELSPFAGNRPDLNGFADQIREKTPGCDREVLVAQLRQQYDKLLHSAPEVAANVDALLDERTFTVTTGHQLNIFTGPLYFIFKIISTIRLARDLQDAFPDYRFVPVYWMATEDHDFAEINHVRLHGKKISWETDAAGATGRLNTASINEAVRQYQKVLGLSANSNKLAGLVEEAYLGHDTLAGATRYFVNALFGAYGLVVLDADSAALKQRFSPYIAQDIFGGHSHKAIDQTSNAMRERGFHTQVHAREINFFYLTDGFRERIVHLSDGRYEVLQQDVFFTEDEDRKSTRLNSS